MKNDAVTIPSAWEEFYNSIKGADWPECKNEKDFDGLPETIRKECQDVFGYIPGQYRGELVQRTFPIVTKTSCQLKWTWSTIFCASDLTSSCHRSNLHTFDVNSFNFHNTESKIKDRENMLQDKWPDKGCEYCKKIEDAGGQSDRLTNFNFPGVHYPPELDHDLTATSVSPRILEVYLNNTCNLKCTYCTPVLSSAWDTEIIKHGSMDPAGRYLKRFSKSKNLEKNVASLLSWIKTDGGSLTRLNVLGGEPLYQPEFFDLLDTLEEAGLSNLNFEIFSNLHVPKSVLRKALDKIKPLKDKGKINKFTIVASIDCWGEEQEYARHPLTLSKWEENFNLILDEDWIDIVIGSTITPLTVFTLPDLYKKLAIWNKKRPVLCYANSVAEPEVMLIDILGDRLLPYFDKAINQLLDISGIEPSSIKYLEGIRLQSANTGTNYELVKKLTVYLDELDKRRNTDWRETFPILKEMIDSIIIK